MSTKRVRLVVAYDGTDFRGWAAQTGQRTVQSTLTEAVRRVSGEEIEIVGASRTDSGAHARGQVCHFDSEVALPVERWPGALNRVLPSDLAVVRAEAVADDFHSRFCAESRTYCYRIWCGAADPFRERWAHGYRRPLDVEAMHRAAAQIIGSHDFRAYSEEIADVANTVRRVIAISVSRSGQEVRVDVRATAFLRGMMRRIAGVLLDVGRGKRPESEVGDLLHGERRDHLQWPVVLPAKGLTLMRVRYGRHPRDHRRDDKAGKAEHEQNNDN